VSVATEEPTALAAPAASMRVAMVIEPFRPVLGGAQRQLERLGPLLKRRGVAATVLTRRPPGTLPRERVADLEVRRLYTPPTAGAASVAYSLGAAVALVRLRPDVVHVHGLLSPATAALLSGATGRAPVVAKALSCGPEGDIHSLLRKPLGATRLREIGRRFAAFTATSRETEHELIEFGIPAGRIARIPNGVDVESFRPPRAGERERLRRQLGLSREEPIALYCGRFDSGKRVPRLIEIFRWIRRGSLLLVGSGEEEERIRQLAADRELEGRIEVRSAVADTRHLYRAADLYLSASIQEGLSGSVLEAMASGLCVAALPASGMTELLQGGAGVLLPESGEPRELASEVEHLLADPARRARLGVAARARAAAGYSLESVADRLRELYANVRDQHGRAV
jgi:glycosyltransferase involved in cell wall biosynthesis